jgi:hypothetical protein
VGLFCNSDLAALMLNGHGPKAIGLKVSALVPKYLHTGFSV